MIVLVYLILCAVVGYVASQKGRSGFGWFLFSLLLSPLLGIIVVAVTPTRASAHASLESQVRDSVLTARYGAYIRSHKPAFSNRVVHDVDAFGEKKRFRSKSDAIAYCMMRLPQDEPQAVLAIARDRR